MLKQATAIDGVFVHLLAPHQDSRGCFTEIYRESWQTGFRSIQWNLVTSRAQTLRGVHVHKYHYDYLMVLSGTLVLGLHDFRPGSASNGKSELLPLTGESKKSVAIPPGVCHGFYFPEPTTHLYSVSEYFDPDDELGCRYDCPELNLNWPDAAPVLSDRDRSAGSYADMLRKMSLVGQSV
ncbi:MAG: dTDP-4-dehydrorhamnose 3,5-epimerase family protein [Hoeflea sp.]|uniref:dTDP-4-dehydrorhamnose 3,5-epimerase family protein n=1 Tax=Hoeflea sp. TaxID=1940281 RepID=UPI003EF10008